MTVEEKNRDIDLYMGNKYENPLTCLYNHSWDMLMPVWSKLRGELEGCMNARTNKYIVVDGAATHLGNIKVAILTPDLPKSHSLIHSAIEWLNKNKV